MEVKDIAEYEETDSRLARNTIAELHQRINEARKYIMSELITDWDIKNGGHVTGSDLPVEAITPILEILDKADKGE